MNDLMFRSAVVVALVIIAFSLYALASVQAFEFAERRFLSRVADVD